MYVTYGKPISRQFYNIIKTTDFIATGVELDTLIDYKHIHTGNRFRKVQTVSCFN